MRYGLLLSFLLLTASVNAQDLMAENIFELRFRQEQSPVNQRRLDAAESAAEACLEGRAVWRFVYSNDRGRRGLAPVEGTEVSETATRCMRRALSRLRLRRGESMQITAVRHARFLAMITPNSGSSAANGWHLEDSPELPPGRIEVRTFSAEGPLTPAEVAVVVEPALQAMKRCYELLNRPRMSGPLDFGFVVSADGRVTDARFAVSDLGSNIGCFRLAVAGLRFEPRASKTNVLYSVLLSRQ